MKKILLLFVALLGSTMLFAEGRVVRDTFHYATHDGQELYLDRYMTEVASEELSPVMIFAFGGGFVGGERDREYYADYFRRLAEAGIVAVSIDYRLGLKSIPEGIGLIDMIGMLKNAVNIAVEDMYAATCYVIDNQKEWRIDPEKIMISGSSAGAITALQAEWNRCNGTELAAVLHEGFRYAAVVSCAGAIFTTKGKPKFEAEPAPMLLFHGSSDSNVPYNKASVMGVGFYGSEYVARQLEKLDAPYYFYAAEYVDHSLAVTPLQDKCDLILQFIEDYVVRGVKAKTTTTQRSCNAEKRPTHFSVKDYLSSNYE